MDRLLSVLGALDRGQRAQLRDFLHHQHLMGPPWSAVFFGDLVDLVDLAGSAELNAMRRLENEVWAAVAADLEEN